MTSTGSSSPPAARSRIAIRFHNNNNRRWDGKVVDENLDWICSLYNKEDLVPGKEVVLPYAKKGGMVQNWNAVIVDPKAEKEPKSTTSTKGRVLARSTYIASYLIY